jgi:hypothetical protein
MSRVRDNEICSMGSAVCIRNSPKFSWQDDLGRQQSENRFPEMGQSRETMRGKRSSVDFLRSSSFSVCIRLS